jgi:hypothetical protein
VGLLRQTGLATKGCQADATTLVLLSQGWQETVSHGGPPLVRDLPPPRSIASRHSVRTKTARRQSCRLQLSSLTTERSQSAQPKLPRNCPTLRTGPNRRSCLPTVSSSALTH